MKLEVVFGAKHKGYMPKAPTEFNTPVVVLTGRNGAGKSRFLEGLQRSIYKATLNGYVLQQKDIRFVPHMSLAPQGGVAYDDSQYEMKIKAILKEFDEVKRAPQLLVQSFSQVWNQQIQIQSNFMAGASISLNKAVVHKELIRISEVTGKDVGGLTHEDIKLNFEESAENIIGINNISSIFNGYIKKQHQNKFNKFRVSEGEDVNYYSDEDFKKIFGEKPWIVLDKIIDDIFEGKFQFETPDEKALSYSYEARLVHKEDGFVVKNEDLSTGEKTLLWLALTLFNSQFYESEVSSVPKLLLMDEPDAFLHPKMVAKMYQVMSAFNRSFGTAIIITTHSPTTVALAPEGSVHLIDDEGVSAVDKDGAIAELLDGVTQISLSPENRRQVMVESHYDAGIFEEIYSRLVHRSRIIDPKISLTFISAGPKMPRNHVVDKVKQVLGVTDSKRIDDFISALNGAGSCSQVEGQVEALFDGGNRSIRGIIDRDHGRSSSGIVVVLGEGYCYSIENIALDPICIMLLLSLDYQTVYPMTEVCGENVEWQEWLENDELLQQALDFFMVKLFGRNNRDAELRYFGGIKLLTDTVYLNTQGHVLEALIKEIFPQLRRFGPNTKDGDLKTAIVRKYMLSMTRGRFIPESFEYAIARVQR